ncbi:MAG: hypothetical protein QF563_01745, partial [Candidatus Marinimicrobia bacterium]|nr:hypothetical protein [Candidatus Neomarinimicrobiota bacterium]
LASTAYAGDFFPNPEEEFHSKLADKNDNNNLTGFKNDKVDELIAEYNICFDQKKRIELLKEIDGIYNVVHPESFSIARNYIRMMWWDKFGYPEWMFERHRGDQWGLLKYWWIDPEKEANLEKAMAAGEKLPLAPLDMKYWPEYLKSQ